MASPGTQPGIIRFGPFELDAANRELRKRGIAVKLQPQPLAVLLMLVQRAGQIVSRDDIHQHIWGPDVFVDFERAINFSINQIRTALGDDAEKPRFIETLPRRGYRFIAVIEHGEPEETVHPVTPTSVYRKSAASAHQRQVNSSSDFHAVLPAPPARLLSASKILVGCFIAFLAAGAGLFLSRLWHPHVRSAQTRTAANVRTFPLMTFSGEIVGLALSPDGREVAFTWNGPSLSKWDIYVQRIGGDRPLQITHAQGA